MEKLPAISNPINKEEDWEGMYEQRSNYYEEIANKLRINFSIWSNFDVVDFNKVPFPEVKKLRYDYVRYKYGNDVADRDVIQPATWAVLWKLADEMMRTSRDEHHVFIEAFYRDKEDPSLLIFSTGS